MGQGLGPAPAPPAPPCCWGQVLRVLSLPRLPSARWGPAQAACSGQCSALPSEPWASPRLQAVLTPCKQVPASLLLLSLCRPEGPSPSPGDHLSSLPLYPAFPAFPGLPMGQRRPAGPGKTSWPAARTRVTSFPRRREFGVPVVAPALLGHNDHSPFLYHFKN